MRDLNTQIATVKQEYEVKLAAKDGEISRLERTLSETKASLQDKSFQYSKHSSNLTNEVQVMSDRLQALEREKLDLIERNAKAEEDIRDSF